MASSTKVFVSAGVYTSERDLTFVAQSVGVTTLGLVGETLQGPAFEPIFITNFDEFQVYFGGTSPEKFVNTQIPKYELAYISNSYLQQSNQLFVTRVLGLSGYDAGPSWSIVTAGNVDPSTVSVTGTSGPSYVFFTGTTGNSTNVTITSISSLPSNLQNDFYNSYTTFNGGTSSISDDFKDYISDQIGLYSTSSALSGKTSYFWGAVSSSTINSVTGSPFNTTATTETFGVSSINQANIDFSSTINDPWFYATFDYYQGTNDINGYIGYGFGSSLDSISAISASV